MLSKLHCPAPHGRLEALLEEPEAPRGVALVCHPHPLHGGTMNNNVVYRTAKVLVSHGVATLRFNFRGVGTSTGTHAEGVGELDDVAAALAFMLARHPGLPVWIAGVSFGARVGMAFGVQDARVGRLLGIGLVPRLFDFSFLATSPKPKALVHGENDELGDLASVSAIADGMAEPKKLTVVPGANHLFVGKLDELQTAVEESIAFLQERS